MPSSTDVFDAFKAWWSNRPALAGFSGPYRGRAPGIVPPFVIFTSVANTLSGESNSTEYWRVVFQVSYFDKDSELAKAGINTIGDQVDKAVLLLANGAILKVQRRNEIFVEDDEFVAHAAVEYETIRTKDRLR